MTTCNLVTEDLSDGYVLFVSASYALDMPDPIQEGKGFGHIVYYAGLTTAERAAIDGNVDALSLAYSPMVGALILNGPAVTMRTVTHVWAPDAALLAAADGRDLPPTERRAWMEDMAREACERYSDWSQGKVYAYEVSAYLAQRDGAGQVITEKKAYADSEPIHQVKETNLYDWSAFRSDMDAAAHTVADALACPDLAL